MVVPGRDRDWRAAQPAGKALAAIFRRRWRRATNDAVVAAAIKCQYIFQEGESDTYPRQSGAQVARKGKRERTVKGPLSFTLVYRVEKEGGKGEHPRYLHCRY